MYTIQNYQVLFIYFLLKSNFHRKTRKAHRAEARQKEGQKDKSD